MYYILAARNEDGEWCHALIEDPRDFRKEKDPYIQSSIIKDIQRPAFAAFEKNFKFTESRLIPADHMPIIIEPDPHTEQQRLCVELLVSATQKLLKTFPDYESTPEALRPIRLMIKDAFDMLNKNEAEMAVLQNMTDLPQ